MKVLIFGTGTMGVGIAQVLMNSEIIVDLHIYSRTEKGISNLNLKCETYNKKMVSKGIITEDQSFSNFRKLKFINDTSDLTSYNLIIEAISENPTDKIELFKKIKDSVHPEAIIASNTSSISISSLSNALTYSENLVGLHFFNPAPSMKLVEVIAGFISSEKAVNNVFEFAKLIGKEPVLVKESPGFVVNRMLIPMINEAICILAENVATLEDIDKSMILGANHPMGPLKLSDLIGNDVVLSIMDTLYTETGDTKYRANTLLRRMVRCNHLGRKTGIGFYKYTSN